MQTLITDKKQPICFHQLLNVMTSVSFIIEPVMSHTAVNRLPDVCLQVNEQMETDRHGSLSSSHFFI